MPDTEVTDRELYKPYITYGNFWYDSVACRDPLLGMSLNEIGYLGVPFPITLEPVSVLNIYIDTNRVSTTETAVLNYLKGVLAPYIDVSVHL